MTEILLSTTVFVALVLSLSTVVLAARRSLLPAEGVKVTVNGIRELTGLPGTTLLDVMLDAKIPIPAACGGKGTCGLCRVQVSAGGGPVLPTEASRLDGAKLRSGTRLACQVRLREAIAVEVDPALLEVQSHVARLVSTRALTPTIKELVFEVPDPDNFDFVPGGFVLITAPAYKLPLGDIDMAPFAAQSWSKAGLVAGSKSPVARAYSVANRPQDAGRIVLNVRLALPPPNRPALPPGVVSSWLFGLKLGDTARLAGPFGDFRATQSQTEMVMVGGGVGMAPLRAIVHDQMLRKTGRKITFFFGARVPHDLFYADEFSSLAETHTEFEWVPVLSETDDRAWSGETGFVHEALIRRHLDTHPAPEACEYYLCGPPLMIRAVKTALHEAGVDRAQIFFDDFGS